MLGLGKNVDVSTQLFRERGRWSRRGTVPTAAESGWRAGGSVPHCPHNLSVSLKVFQNTKFKIYTGRKIPNSDNSIHYRVANGDETIGGVHTADPRAGFPGSRVREERPSQASGFERLQEEAGPPSPAARAPAGGHLYHLAWTAGLGGLALPSAPAEPRAVPSVASPPGLWAARLRGQAPCGPAYLTGCRRDCRPSEEPMVG